MNHREKYSVTHQKDKVTLIKGTRKKSLISDVKFHNVEKRFVRGVHY